MRISDWSSDVCSSDLVEVARLARPIFAVGGDRGQRRAAEIIIDLAREAVIFRLAGEAAARSDRKVAAITLVEGRKRLAEVGEYADDIVRRRRRGPRRARGVEIADIGIDRRADIGGAAAFLRSEEHTSELQALMRISYAVLCLK